MLDKLAVLASIHRVLKLGDRFFCLILNVDYVWCWTTARMLGSHHPSSDRMLIDGDVSARPDEAGFCCSWGATWTFAPKEDMSAVVGLMLTVVDAVKRHARLDSLRGGLSQHGWKGAS